MPQEINNFIGIKINELAANSNPQKEGITLFGDAENGDLSKVTYQQVIDLVVSEMGSQGVAYQGAAVPSTDPGTPENAVFYTATEAGTYTNFLDSDSNAIVLNDGDFAILSYNGSSWVKQVIDLTEAMVSKSDIADDLITYDATKVLSAKQGVILDKSINILVEFVDKSPLLINSKYVVEGDGSLVSKSNYVSNDPMPVTPGQKIKYNGFTGASNVDNYAICPIAGYDETGDYVGAVLPNGAPDNFGTTIDTIVTIPSGIATIIASFRINEGDPLEFAVSQPKGTNQIEDNTEILNSIYTNKEISQDFNNVGYIDKADGSFVVAQNYKTSDFLDVSQGDIFTYSATVGYLVSCIAGYDASGNFVKNVLAPEDSPAEQTFTGRQVSIPSGIDQVRISYRINEEDTHSVLRVSLSVSIDTIDTSSINYVQSFMPKNVFGKAGEMVRLYKMGILSKNIDARWSIGGNQEFWGIDNPTMSDDGSTVSLKIYDLFGKDKNIGTTTVKIVDSVVSPSDPKCVLCIGDSLTEGVNASIDAAWVNEFSRRLTGVGTGIGDIQPASASLSNIQFIGTLGSSPIKAEGRGGWSAGYYLTRASVGSRTNAFWDGSKFNIDYYLSENNFYTPDLSGGVTETGDNLIAYILLGWNDIRLDGVEGYKSNLEMMVDSIIASLPDVKIKLLGIEAPPSNVFRTDKTDWSPRYIMENYVIPQHEAGAEIASTRANVEHLPVAAFFSEVGSFSVNDNRANRRVSDQISIPTDNVHCNDNGYAQIADVAYYNFLYNYCNGD